MADENFDMQIEEDRKVLAALERDRRRLQNAVALAALVPAVAGFYGVLFGPQITGEHLGISGDSHYRFLSGLNFGIGLLFWSTIPGIEVRGPRFRLLALLVFIGGLSRTLGMLLTGVPSLYMVGALVFELLILPLLCLWQWRVARGYLVQEKKAATPRKTPDFSPSAPPRPAAPKSVLPEDVPEPIPSAGPAPTPSGRS